MEEKWSCRLWSNNLFHLLQQYSLPGPGHHCFVFCAEEFQPHRVSFITTPKTTEVLLPLVAIHRYMCYLCSTFTLLRCAICCGFSTQKHLNVETDNTKKKKTKPKPSKPNTSKPYKCLSSAVGSHRNLLTFPISFVILQSGGSLCLQKNYSGVVKCCKIVGLFGLGNFTYKYFCCLNADNEYCIHKRPALFISTLTRTGQPLEASLF